METTTKSSATNNGLYLGGILSLITVLLYAVNLDLFTEWWLGIILFVVVVAFGVISAIKSRTLLNGFISFKQAFTSYFITVLIGSIISTVLGIVIFTFIDPEAATYINEQILVVTKQTMERFGMPQEAMQVALEEARAKLYQLGSTPKRSWHCYLGLAWQSSHQYSLQSLRPILPSSHPSLIAYNRNICINYQGDDDEVHGQTCRTGGKRDD